MLLSLLRPEVRAAYLDAHVDFPLQGKSASFIGAGINLTHSRVIDFGQRPLPRGRGTDAEVLPIYFGDFVNYWIVYDLFKSLELLSRAPEGIPQNVRPNLSADLMADAAARIVRADCWFGYVAETPTWDGLKNRIAERIGSYLSFFNFNSDSIPDSISNSKTSIGEPISLVAEVLRQVGIIGEDVHVFVQIDQYEELLRLEGRYKELGVHYRAVINRALGLRDPRVSYRIGTRRYGWTESQLERDRDYKLIDLDQTLRRSENRKTWLFPRFAEDVLRKRLQVADYDIEASERPLTAVFGRGYDPKQKALRYAGSARTRAVRVEPQWPLGWCHFLSELAETDPLSARLAESWARQKGKESIMKQGAHEDAPWNKDYWRKERVEHALMQIASRCGQRMIWSGTDEILGLSGGNILIFVSICQHIWNAWIRAVRPAVSAPDRKVPQIDDSIQAVGVHEASTHWHRKVTEQNGGSSRQRFLTVVARTLEKRLLGDLPLSYPGNNGFSVAVDDLDADQEVSAFLDQAASFGDLFDSPHTTKEKDRKERRKWYLNPILCPYFNLPHIRTKEPFYVDTPTVREWMMEAEILLETPGRPRRPNEPKISATDISRQPTLFDEPATSND
ncbi:hypothetical protein F183_A10580 [Bryobacterales bacterium F-183]|nr:hypothetical protein F183_A10580 [Bryobacterales bacterium F-183]